MKTIIKGFIFTFCVALLILGLTQDTDATISTRSNVATSNANGVPYMQWNYTWAASADTMRTKAFKWEEFSKGKQTVGQLWIGTSSIRGDSVDLCVRYEISMDGTNWQVFTLGTDSTTWITTLTGTNYKINVIDIEQATHGGYAPYCRVTIYGKNTYNVAGTKVKLYAVSQ